MFDYLRGHLVHRKPARVVVDVGGVGYELFIPLSTYSKLPPRGHEAQVLVHYHLRDDGVRLFGFATNAERALFRTLIGISGIGPALGIQVLSAMTIRRFYEAVDARDERALTGIKGIGKRTAQRMIVELAGKLPDLPPVGASPLDAPDEVEVDDLRVDARVALETLGVAPDKAVKAIEKAFKELGTAANETSADVLVRTALRYA